MKLIEAYLAFTCLISAFTAFIFAIAGFILQKEQLVDRALVIMAIMAVVSLLCGLIFGFNSKPFENL